LIVKGGYGMKTKSGKFVGLTTVVVFILLLGSLPVSAQEEQIPEKRFGFGFGLNYYQGMDSRFNGNSNLFLLTFKLSDQFYISILREEMRMNGSGKSSKDIKKDLDVDCSIVGLRLQRRISKLLSIGIDLGNASYSNGFSDNAFMAGIVATVTAFQTDDQLFLTKLDIDLGYRILNTDNTDLFDNPNNLVKDFDSFTIGLNFKILF
jgi:opacity protein-like surface antigen